VLQDRPDHFPTTLRNTASDPSPGLHQTPVVGLVVVEDESSGPWRFEPAVAILIGVKLCGPRCRLVACLLIPLIAVTALTSAATGAKRDRTPTCTWGASSIRAEVVDGQIVVGEPTTSGCIP
jgi:hypothetical protein